MEKRFSYGTLQQPDVQMATFGRVFAGVADTLLGYRVTTVKIADAQAIALSGKEYHPMLVYTGYPSDKISGMVFELTSEELLQADAYEDAAYVRKLGPMLSGGQAWIYADVNDL